MSDPRSATPTISRIFDDGTLVELIFDHEGATTALVVSPQNVEPSVETVVVSPTGERLVPYSAGNNLITSGCVLLPSCVGDYGDKGDLVDEVCRFLHAYVDLSPVVELIVAHYVLLTWVYDAFNDLPYLRFRGDYGTGKTRALLAVGSICYKPFFASGASTVSPIFHIQDALQGTLILDEADFRTSDQTAELTKVLNNGTTRGMPVLRTMTNRHRELNPTAFRVFGPKVVAMRGRFDDRALESRFITAETGGTLLRKDIPIHLPTVFAGQARELRNKLLSWRLRSWRETSPDTARLIDGVEPRTNQTALSLLSLVDAASIRSEIASLMADQAAMLAEERADSAEIAMLRAVREAMTTGGSAISISSIADAFNRAVEDDYGCEMSRRWVGSFLRRRFHLSTIKSRGNYVVPATERPRVMALLQRMGSSDPAVAIGRRAPPPRIRSEASHKAASVGNNEEA